MTQGVHVTRHQGLLGTVVELHMRTSAAAAADTCESAIIGEIERLQRVFNAFDDSSELSKWKRGAMAPGTELAEVLTLAASWQSRSYGAFNVAVGALLSIWSQACASDEPPTPEGLLAVAERCARPPYRSTDSGIETTAPLDSVDLNAIAKGWIIDRASTTMSEDSDVVGLTINAGGDLLHRGSTPLIVGIEDPRRPFDNVPPLVEVALHNGALATSGGSRRGWEIGGRWYGHVIDPRTGWPAEHTASASVLAPDAATADVVATILTVLGPDEGMAFVDAIGDVGCLIVGNDGLLTSNDAWHAVSLS